MKRGAALTLLLVAMLPLAGCWSRNELNELAIVVGMGIDKVDGKYNVSVQTVNPSQVSSRNGVSTRLQPVVTISGVGSTVPEALRKMTVQTSKRLYFSHLRLVIFGEKLARSGLGDAIDYISREPEMRNDFYLIVAKEATPEEILGIFGVMDPIPANSMYTKLSNADKLWAAAGQITLDSLLRDLMQPGKSPVLSAVHIKGSRRKGTGETGQTSIRPVALLEYAGMAAFRGDRMVGWLNEEQTKTLNYMQNSIHQTLGTGICPGGGTVSYAVTSSRTQIKVARNGDMPIIRVKIFLEMNIADTSCKLDMVKQQTLDLLQKMAEDRLGSIVRGGVDDAQRRLRSDIFGLGEEVHRQQPALWHRIEDWNKTFEQTEVQIRTIFHIRKMGSITQSVNSKINRGTPLK